MPLTGFSWWKRAPMGRLAIPFTFGIWAGDTLSPDPAISLAAVIVLAILLQGQLLMPSWFRFSLQPLSGIFLVALVAFSGALAVGIEAHKRLLAAGYTQEGMYRFMIEDCTPARTGGYRMVTRAARLDKHAFHAVPGKTLVYLRSGQAGAPVLPGERIYAHARLQTIPGPLNPGEPDFHRIYARDGIYTTGFLEEEQFVRETSGKGRSMHRTLYRQRGFMLQVLRRHIRDSTAAGLAEAILVGYRNDLSPELGNAYARTGVMHVIAISGLHLGLIFSILLSLFRIIPRQGRKPWLPLLVAVPAIWWFSLLTGGSASVIRSAVMSSLPVLGALMQRRTWTINVCSGSMVLLLCWNPYWLWDAGFQLSYAAVWGILLYQRPLSRRLPLSHPAAVHCWQLVSVTLAAQVFTTPLVMYYFHQFPLLFLFANLVAVPLSSIILLGTMLICLLSGFPNMASTAGEWTEWLIHFLNNFIRRIDMVPYSVLHHLYINACALLLVFALLISLHLVVTRGARIWKMPAFLSAALLLAALIYQALVTSSQSATGVLQIRGHTALFQLSGRAMRQFLLPAGRQQADRVPVVLATARKHYRIRRDSSMLLEQAPVQLLRTGRLNVLLVSAAYHDGLAGRLPRADLVLLRENAGASSLETWYRVTGCTRFVADGTNSLWKILQWREEAKKLPLRLHSTPLQGAFLLD